MPNGISPSGQTGEFIVNLSSFFADPLKFLKKERDLLLVHEGSDLTVCLLSAFKQFVSREAEQDLSVDRVRAHERLVVGQRLGQLVDLTLAEGRVRARSARGARQAQEV